MYKSIKDFCENGDNNGLFLLDMPTGFGKTYSVIQFIYDFAVNLNNKDRKIFFLTTQKKNLPIKELKKRFEENNCLNLYAEKFLFLAPSSEYVIENFSINMQIPYSITKTEEYKLFKETVLFLQEQKNKTDKNPKSYNSTVAKTFENNIEPAFRKLIHDVLFKSFKTAKERMFAIKTNNEWQWIGQLYPSVFTSERQIIFMSVNKFLCLNDTLIENKYMFYTSNIIKNAIIIIDEFDATKETILSNIIDNGLNERIDYVRIFAEIYSALKTVDFPSEITIPSKQRLNGKYKDQSLEVVLNRTMQIADELYDSFSLNYNHKTVEITDESKNNFLFQDHRFMSVLNGNKNYILIKKDNSSRYNYIDFSSEKPTNERENLTSLLSSLRGFIRCFKYTVYILAYNLKQQKDEQRSNDDGEYTFENALHSVLSLFKLSFSNEKYLMSQILMMRKETFRGITGSEYDLTVYENGFRYYAFDDSNDHTMDSKIMMYSFDQSPEKILLKICEKAKVIGISATATIPSVVGNYDLNYLQSKMGSLFKTLSYSDRKRLSEQFEREQFGYEKVNINVELISSKGSEIYSCNSWLQIFSGDNSIEAAQNVYGYIENNCIDNNNSAYNRERYLRIAAAYTNFILHKDIHSFLCVLTKHPRKNDPYLNIDVLINIFKIISQFYSEQFNENSIVQLDGEEFDNKKDEIIRRLSNGEKLFVISVYQTIGAGQNLQYKAPAKLKRLLIKINDRKNSDEKDFDAIYLDRPTNLVVNLNNGNLNESDFVKYIFQHEFLQEIGELSQNELSYRVKKGFKALISEHKPYLNNLKSASIVMLATKVIIQAIGRICRTNLKNPNIYIFADEQLSDFIDPSVIEHHVFNKEFIALVNKIEKSGKNERSSIFVQRANIVSDRVNRFILSMIPRQSSIYKWNEDTMKHWQELRDFVLKYPTFSIDDGYCFMGEQFYIKQPFDSNVLFYSQNNDYSRNSISFTYGRETPFEVSARAARLDRILSFGTLKQWFKENDFATSFLPKEYIMSPPLFNNIYKGALGELVGWYLFKTVVNQSLTPIKEPELFELFDYRVSNTKIFVDFKHWHESNQEIDNKEIIFNKIKYKAKICGGKCVIIANIISENYYEPTTYSIDGIKVLACPSLLIDKENDVILNNSAFDMIRKCINEFNKDQ